MAKSNLVEGLFSLNGRAPRSEWWLVGFGLSILGGVLSIVVIAVLFGGEAINRAPEPHPGAAAVRFIASLLIAWPIIAVSVRRAHDRGNGGWLVFVYYALNLLIGGVDAFAHELIGQEAIESGSPLAWGFMVVALVSLCVTLWLLVTLGFLPGKREPNRYGQPAGGGASNYRAAPVE